ncbi:MAG TPA: hypothetical protein VFK47_20765 [Ktedonobacteraceae bacterium]|nr:hypothetical protein [Ktedonobacteraceae bacterium]
MAFVNSVVGQFGTLVRNAIRSPNFVHNVSGWTINQDGSAEFNNLTVRGTFNGTNYTINSSGAFFYSGTPAHGNLIVSITSASGTDSFGNSYPQGINVTTGTISGTAISAGTITGTAISGGTITGTTITGGTIQTSSSNPKVLLSGANNDLEVFNSAGTQVGTFGGSTGALTVGSATGSHFKMDPSTSKFDVFNSSNQLVIDFNGATGVQTILNNVDTTFSQINSSTSVPGVVGGITFGGISAAGSLPTASQIAQAGGIGPAPTLGLNILSPTSTGTRDHNAQINLFPGVNSGVTGTTNAATVQVRSINGTGNCATDLEVQGSIIRLDASTGFPVTWQTPSMGTGWATGSGIGGSYPPLQWRLDAENNVHLFGVFHATSTTPGSVIASGFQTVSVGGNVGVVGSFQSINSANRSFSGYLNSSGNLNASVIGTIAVNDTFMVNAKVPIGNLS